MSESPENENAQQRYSSSAITMLKAAANRHLSRCHLQAISRLLRERIREQAIFADIRVVGEETLWMCDGGRAESCIIVAGHVAGLVLNLGEGIWLYGCWLTATCGLRQ